MIMASPRAWEAAQRLWNATVPLLAAMSALAVYLLSGTLAVYYTVVLGAWPVPRGP